MTGSKDRMQRHQTNLHGLLGCLVGMVRESCVRISGKPVPTSRHVIAMRKKNCPAEPEVAILGFPPPLVFTSFLVLYRFLLVG